MYKRTIQSLLSKQTETKPFFRGVFCADEVPFQSKSDKKQKCFYVFNLDNLDEPGSHWVVVMLSPQRNLYFDSYGEPPPTKN